MAVLWVALMPNLLGSPAAQENRYLIVNGQSSQVAVLQINGRSYADLEALARAVNGSLAFNGDQIALALPASATSPPSASSPDTSRSEPGLSKAFLKGH